MTAWDIAVVGAGPAGAATAIGALRADPSLRVALLDRFDFPRDKSCGDGIAPHVIDLLTSAGVDGIVDDWTPVPRLRLSRDGLVVDGEMRRPTWVIPRTFFDHRLVEAAQKAGAELVRHRVRSLEGTTLDGEHSAKVVVGADGPHSVVRRSLGLKPGPMAVAIRGYAPTPSARRGQQVIAFGGGRQPAYAWAFDRGDGLSNIGYGELLAARPTRAHLLEQVEKLLPGSTEGAADWVGHQLPLSSGRTPTQRGPVLLAGDAAGLVNPLTGEGIYYAVATGLSAGRAAAEAIAAADPGSAGDRHGRTTTALLGSHLRHIAVAGRLCRSGAVLDAGLRTSAADKAVFDDLVELGLANGRITPRLVRGLAREFVGTARRKPPKQRQSTKETRA